MTLTPEDACEQAAARVNYRLTYAATDQPRKFASDVMFGPKVPNSYRPDELSEGDWFDNRVGDNTVESWFERFFERAVSEAVHEALEWFQVDGKPWLDPHSTKIGDEISVETEIHELSSDFAERLIALRKRSMQ